jgi:hypothetical protein
MTTQAGEISDAAAEALIAVLSQGHLDRGKVEITKTGNWERSSFVGELKPDLARSPFVLFDTDGERLFTPDESMLLSPFHKIIGDRAEVMIPHDNYYKVVVLSKLHKLPRRVLPPPMVNAKHFYKLSFLKVRDGKTIFSTSGAICESSTGKVYGCAESGFNFISNYLINRGAENWNETKTTAVLCASMIEDFRLDWRWHVSLSDSAEIVFPTDALGAQQAFAMRDVPEGKRRKAILHWVKSHTRVKSAREFDVKQHLRGVTEFSVDGIRCKITSPEKLRGKQ